MKLIKSLMLLILLNGALVVAEQQEKDVKSYRGENNFYTEEQLLGNEDINKKSMSCRRCLTFLANMEKAVAEIDNDNLEVSFDTGWMPNYETDEEREHFIACQAYGYEKYKDLIQYWTTSGGFTVHSDSYFGFVHAGAKCRRSFEWNDEKQKIVEEISNRRHKRLFGSLIDKENNQESVNTPEKK